MTFEERLFELRKERGWSQEQLAEKLSVSRQAISKWESGVARPDTDKLILLSRVFGVTLDSIVNDSFAPIISNTSTSAQGQDNNTETHSVFCNVMEPTNDKQTNDITYTVPLRRNKLLNFIKMALIVLAIYMLTFAVAIATKPFLMPFFGIFATGVSIITVILMLRKKH